MEAQNRTCPNPLCGKTFTKPLKAENLSSGTLTVYEACPYCLTEITIEEKETVFAVKQKSEETMETDEAKLEPEQVHEKTVVQQSSTETPETPDCKHHFGYLSERSARDKLPEECMVCPKIVQCMLKGVSS